MKGVTMEGLKVLEDSYDNLCTLCKLNVGSKVTIDYDILDIKTRDELRKLIDDYIQKRRTELWRSLQGTRNS